MTRSEVDALPTRGLLARLRRLNWCEDSLEKSDLTEEEAASARPMILFKNDRAWLAARDDVRAALSTREHVKRDP